MTSATIGNGTPALATASLKTNKLGKTEKWWVTNATYIPGKNIAIKNAIHLKILVKLVKYLFK